MSTDGDLPQARSALRAAQSGLTEGLLRLRMASSARGIGAPLGEGEFSGGGGGASPGSSGGPSLRSQFGMFLPGGLGGGGSGGLRVDDDDVVSLGVRTILDSDVGSYQVIPGLEGRVETPLSFERPEFARGGGGGGSAGAFSTPQDLEESDGSRPATRSLSAHGLYGPHEPGTGICGGIVARGAQGPFPDRFCLKTRCGFASHSSKSYLSKLKQGAYYVKANDSHGYSNLYLSGEAARLAPEGLLARRNNLPGWKAVIRQLEDQLAAGPPETQQAAVDQAEGLMGFADRMFKTPYATTPMRPTRRRRHDEVGDDDEDNEERGGGLNEDVLALLQRLGDSVGHMRGELGVWSSEARYLTLHEGMVALSEDHTNLHQEVLMLSNKLHGAALRTEQQAGGLRAELQQVRGAMTSLGAEVAHLTRAQGHGGDVDALRREVRGLQTERADLESTVLALTSAVTGLMEAVTNGPSPSPDQSYLEGRFTAYDAAISGRLDSLRQEMKGGGITVGGVVFSGREAAMDWARIHLPPNTYQCIGGMVYAMCLISEAVVHQEDMMKREEHGERVKRTPMQSAQVLSVHTSYPPVLDGAKSVQRDAKYDFLALKTYKQWKPVDGEGTYKMLKDGVERSFELIKNAIDSTFGMKPQARAVLLDLLTEFKMMYHELFVMEINLFYEETLNKVGGEHPSDASRVQCWALVTKLLRTVFKATHGARSFATEAGGPGMDPLQTNGYFLYAALEELRVLKEFSKVKWRRHEEFGHTMLGFVFENSVSKAVLDARPNPVLKLNGVDEQLKVFRATVDHIQTNLAQIRAHANMNAMKPVGKKAKGGAVAEIE